MRFGVLGAVEAVHDGVAVSVGRPRHRALLGFLLTHANRTVTTDALIEALWGGRPPGTARTQIHAMVSAVRHALAAGGDGDRITTVGAGYRCVLDSADLDLGRFDSAVVTARRLTEDGQHRAAVTAWRAALDLWRGQALEGIDAPYVETVRARLEEQRIAACEAVAELELGLHGHADLVPELTALIDSHPLRERLVELLMTALYRCGRQADALRVGRELRARLADQLGLDPGRSFTDLEQAIRTQDPSLRLTPMAMSAPVPAQLPAEPSDFTGRDAQVEHLNTLLDNGLGVLTGAGGVGKTTLAVHWAGQAREHFPDGQLYANLNGYATTAPLRPIDVLARFLRAFGVTAEQIPVDEEEAAALYRSLLADRRVLVLLDNAASADQVRPLLPGAPNCLVLVTSRDRLAGLVARDGARRVDLDVLSAAEATALVATIIGPGRAGAEPTAVAALVELCGGLPLALRIAAATLADRPELAVADYARQLTDGDRLSALDIDGDDTSSVSTTFDLSYRGLPAELRELFGLLGILPVLDFTADAAAVLIGQSPERTATLLDRLVTAHLVERAGPGRHTLHDLVRLYARRQAERDHPADTLTATLDRVHGWYLHSARAASDRLYPGALRLPLEPTDLPIADAGLEWLEAERANLVAIVAQCAEQGPARTAWLLADTLRGYFYLRRCAVDWYVVAELALATAITACDPLAEASARLSLGHAHLGVNDTGQAIAEFTTALALAERSDWPEGVATLHNNLGLVYLWRGQLTQSRGHLTRAVAMLAGQEPPARRATAMSNLGFTEHLGGDTHTALERLAAALVMHRQASNRDGEADTLCKTGIVHRDLGNHDLALAAVRAGLAIVASTHSAEFHIRLLLLAGSTRTLLGDLDQAGDDLTLALAMARDTDFGFGVADALLGLARVALRRSSPELAQIHVIGARAVAEKFGYRLLQGDAFACLAEIALADDDSARAEEYTARALFVYQEAGHQVGVANIADLAAQITSRTSSPYSSSSARPSTA